MLINIYVFYSVTLYWLLVYSTFQQRQKLAVSISKILCDFPVKWNFHAQKNKCVLSLAQRYRIPRWTPIAPMKLEVRYMQTFSIVTIII